MHNIGLPVKMAEFNCLVCGMTPLTKIQGREFYCTTCNKRLIVSSDYYGIGAGLQIEELNEDTLLVRTRATV